MSDELVHLLSRYRTDPGIHAALLVGADGFLVASSATNDVNTEAVAAHVADMLGICRRMALEIGQREMQLVTFELTQMNVVVAPFDDEMLLVLVGEPEALRLSYSLRGDEA